MGYRYLIEDAPTEDVVYEVYSKAIKDHQHPMSTAFAEASCRECGYRLNLSGKVTDNGRYQSASIQFQNVHEYTPEGGAS